jgi:hypothetical protein
MAIYSGFSHKKLCFSIVMLVYQRVSRVYPRFIPCLSHFGLDFPKKKLKRTSHKARPRRLGPEAQTGNDGGHQGVHEISKAPKVAVFSMWEELENVGI